MITAAEQYVYDVLEKLEISYTSFQHEAVYTIEDTKKVAIEGVPSKNLFVRNQKGNTYYLIIVEDSKRVDLKKAAEQIGSTRLSFASEDRLQKVLQLTTGSVGPFGLLNNKSREVTVVLDKDLFKEEMVLFHPNVNTATVRISTKDFQKYLDYIGNKQIIITIF